MEDTTKNTSVAIENRNAWRWGFTRQAEIWNGRLAMLLVTVGCLVCAFVYK
ncbi:high light inducible protein [Calothrix sp. HK-06]|nr:high light inducible protein [Calothrix sp. HK-06]